MLLSLIKCPRRFLAGWSSVLAGPLGGPCPCLLGKHPSEIGMDRHYKLIPVKIPHSYDYLEASFLSSKGCRYLEMPSRTRLGLVGSYIMCIR
jgi:hypothetical protein